jgi:hypothetical protein
MIEQAWKRITTRRPSTRPTTRRPPLPRKFQFDQNYYRLGYQLAAQRMHADPDPAEARPERAGAARPHGRGREHEEAIRHLERLSGEVEETLDYLDYVAAKSTWPYRRRLTVKERRLQRFLVSTVRPSVELIYAGTLLSHGREAEARDRVHELFAHPRSAVVDWTGPLRSSQVTRIPWSYRAYYTLACFAGSLGRATREPWRRDRNELLHATGRDSGPEPDRRELVGPWALQMAFRFSRDEDRTEIVRWAQEDPSLRPLKHDPVTQSEVEALLRRYRPTAAPPTPVFWIEEWLPPDAGDDLTRRLHAEALDHLLRFRPNHEVHRTVLVVGEPHARRVYLDALLRAKAADARDVVVDVSVGRTDTREATTLADHALGKLSRYESISGRGAVVWAVLVTYGDETLALEESVKAALMERGDATVVRVEEIPALRIFPVPA